MAEKRRLPILQPKPASPSGGQSPGDEEPAAERPPWQWAVIGAVGILIAWIPLSMLAELLRQRAFEALLPMDDPAAVQEAVRQLTAGERLRLSLISVLGPAAALALASLAGGAMVGRFGSGAGKREATLAGVAAAALAAIAAAGQLIDTAGLVTWLMTSAVIVILAALSARLGAALGRPGAPKGEGPPGGEGVKPPHAGVS